MSARYAVFTTLTVLLAFMCVQGGASEWQILACGAGLVLIHGLYWTNKALKLGQPERRSQPTLRRHEDEQVLDLTQTNGSLTTFVRRHGLQAEDRGSKGIPPTSR